MKYKIYLFFLSMLLSKEAVPSVLVWNENQVSESVNDNVQINNDIQVGLGSSTVIHALSNDISVSLFKDVTVYGNDAGQSALTIIAEYPYTVTIYVDKDLTFGGSINNIPLIINHMGSGNIIWVVEDTATLSFGTNEVDRGGVTFQVTAVENTMPSVKFKARRTAQRPAIIFKKNSKVNYQLQSTILNNVTTQLMLLDTSLCQSINEPSAHVINFKDGSGLYLWLNSIS